MKPNVFLYFGGNAKQKVREIIKQAVNYKHYPATLVKPTSGKLIWFLDEEAAEALKK